ncbi:MAG: Transglycosylase-like domain protein [Candidatus Saccharibacteria bacterium]|nr:Transglycosylase-like domain protein [Candidatus Saccharibacteria bacterium]
MEQNTLRRGIAVFAPPLAALAIVGPEMFSGGAATQTLEAPSYAAVGLYSGQEELHDMRSQVVDAREAELAREQAAAERAAAARERAARIAAARAEANRSRSSGGQPSAPRIRIRPQTRDRAASFAALRNCESGGNYQANTGNGYYGAYQFDLRTFHGLGYSGRPDQASPATQDAAADRLQKGRGWSPWPSCARKLGLL